MSSQYLASGSSPKTQPVPFESNAFQPKEKENSVSIELLIPPKFSQPRRYFDEIQIPRLVASIQKSGILQEVLVRHIGDKYEILPGERRYRAALVVGLSEIPVMVRVMSDTDVLELSSYT
jgi:ParB family transcriptional regulator, chromosome partitioning protein